MPIDPQTILILCLIAGFVLGLNMTLIGWLRGDGRVREEASKWTKAFGGSGRARREQEDQVAELHKAVQRLQARGEEPAKSDSDEPA